MKFKIICALIFTLLSVNAVADYTGKIQKIYSGVAYGDVVLVVIDKGTEGLTEACSQVGTLYAYFIKTDLAGGQFVASAALAAYMSQSSVVIQGTGGCSADSNFPGAEELNLLRLE